MRLSTRMGAALAALLAAARPSLTVARGVNVNLTASWPSSPFFPLMETRYEPQYMNMDEMNSCRARKSE
ncbi:hypothetical protein PHYSODRAFT_540532 [Phytophthora sojae]|uniref:Uncharacterized protein n=2 Tax=Phytophthora sojae TaxID=67593 RepID=G4YVL7_PHYSP|nr:hypothetical protein PHYSODRAFT_540532 [Phytophthora sojae]AAO24653.1 unknown protein [Phytophthora sojae]EGZ26049.1 hypothetical protein PHYSODRAFT_540532 [Phytophthora sojae]|eukprot:XP_009521337.1 hypothetical protein PHYSODRAFT_540532 [Phytophthora sojae]